MYYSHNYLTLLMYIIYLISFSLDFRRYLLVSYIFDDIAFSLALAFCKASLRAAYKYIHAHNGLTHVDINALQLQQMNTPT